MLACGAAGSRNLAFRVEGSGAGQPRRRDDDARGKLERRRAGLGGLQFAGYICPRGPAWYHSDSAASDCTGWLRIG